MQGTGRFWKQDHPWFFAVLLIISNFYDKSIFWSWIYSSVTTTLSSCAQQLLSDDLSPRRKRTTTGKAWRMTWRLMRWSAPLKRDDNGSWRCISFWCLGWQRWMEACTKTPLQSFKGVVAGVDFGQNKARLKTIWCWIVFRGWNPASVRKKGSSYIFAMK